MIVKMVGINMRSHYCFITGELSLCQFYADGVDFLGSYLLVRGEGLHEMKKLLAIGFLELLLGCYHLCIGRLRNTITAHNQ